MLTTIHARSGDHSKMGLPGKNQQHRVTRCCRKKTVKCVTAKEDRYKQKMEAYISHLRETTPKGIFKVIFNWSISNGRVESTMKEMQDIR